MTKKDYELIARHLRAMWSTYQEKEYKEREGFKDAVSCLISALREDNKAFSTDKFDCAIYQGHEPPKSRNTKGLEALFAEGDQDEV